MKLPICDPETKKYFEKIVIDVDALYSLATDVRKLGYDIKDEVEIKRATNLAERTEAILEFPGLAKRYDEIMAVKKDRFPTIIQMFDEILDGKLGSFPTDEKRLESAVRTALTLYTEGVVVAPLEGIPAVKISSNSDSTKYADIYYAGPIRAAGGTGTVLPIVLAYYGGKKLGLDRYKATESEIERYVEEYRIIGRKYARQIKVTEDEIRHIIRECPVCINGEATDPEEVDVYRNLERVPTNRLRGGAFLVLTEGVTLKAAKLKKLAKGFGFDWSWLDKFIKVKETGNTTEILPNYRYLEGAAAGRPVFAYPSRFGGFRLRYGRTRTTGLMAKALHPATMHVLGGYAAVGTQLKVERPGKATVIGACDQIEPAYVKLRDKSIVRAESKEWYDANVMNIEKILFVGDMLIPYGDFRKTAHPLMPPGYCEEWWALELEKEIENKKLDKKDFDNFLNNPLNVKEEDAVKLSDSLGVPLHPRYLYFYTQLNQDDIIYIRKALQKAERKYSDGIEFEAVLDYDEKLDFLFTKIVMPMKVETEKIKIKHGLSLFKTFGVFDLEKEIPVGLEALDLLGYLSGFKIKDKAGSFIGARMGRPEAATERKMTGSPQVLFPIGKTGGATRNINKAVDFKSQESNGLFGSKAASTVEIAFYKCPKCRKETVYPYCWECKERTTRQYHCGSCGKGYDERKEKCTCGGKIYHSKRSSLSFASIFGDAVKRLGVEAPAMIKGVEGLVSIDKVAEPIEKGILRAKNGVYVFKDGVCRADLLDFNLSHFKPAELKMTVEKARALGYEIDIYGNELKDANQMLRLFPQDVILNTTVGDYLVKVATFVDDLLEKFYKKPRFYHAKVKDDLIGQYILALAPHIVAGIVGRIIGYSESRVMFSHPYFNTAKRRNTDGDQDSAMLLLDVFLNFSKDYLPSTRGGKQDTPLVATIVLDPQEIDDEAYEMETASKYTLEFYESALKKAEPGLKFLNIVGNFIGTDKQFTELNFTHDTAQYDAGPKQSSYTLIKDMKDKISNQLDLQYKISAVDHMAALELVLSTHFLPDIIGNARKYARQGFRCTKCNKKFRRMPLSGACACGGNINLTIAQGSVRKYLGLADDISKRYKLTDYLDQRIKLIYKEVDSLFNNEKIKQKSLGDFM
ncbi:MAG: DNA polymerase II large subunit [Candidatus ainarchaeum sp.]|nr:DNA polymerase II large subunit [Candidatus ainarchaeum sp.]